MKARSILVQEEFHYSQKDVERAARLVERAKKNSKDPQYIKAAKEFYKYHTGKSLKI